MLGFEKEKYVEMGNLVQSRMEPLRFPGPEVEQLQNLHL